MRATFFREEFLVTGNVSVTIGCKHVRVASEIDLHGGLPNQPPHLVKNPLVPRGLHRIEQQIR
jgi:hypothetical protein